MSYIDVAIQKAAKELNIPYAQAKPVVMAYWKEAFDSLARCENSTITIRNLGCFTTSLYKTNVFIRHVIRRIRRLDDGVVFKDPAKKEKVRAEAVAKLHKAWIQRDKLIVHYKEIEKRRNELKRLS